MASTKNARREGACQSGRPFSWYCALRARFGRRRVGNGRAGDERGCARHCRALGDDRDGDRRNRRQRREQAEQERRVAACVVGKPAPIGAGVLGSVHRTRTRLVLNGFAAGSGDRRVRGSTAGRHRRGNQAARPAEAGRRARTRRAAGERTSSGPAPLSRENYDARKRLRGP